MDITCERRNGYVAQARVPRGGARAAHDRACMPVRWSSDDEDADHGGEQVESQSRMAQGRVRGGGNHEYVVVVRVGVVGHTEWWLFLVSKWWFVCRAVNGDTTLYSRQRLELVSD